MQASPSPLRYYALALAVLALAACDKKQPPAADDGVVNPPGDDGGKAPPPAVRKPAVPTDHPLHARFEGTDFANDCKTDGDCHAAGCSSEVCSADAGVITTCDVPLVSLPAGTACGCVEDQCRWWNAEGTTLPAVEPPPVEPPPVEPPKASCATTTCEAPKQCIEYYGIAGPSGPKFVSCEIPCKAGAKTSGCPAGTTCVTIADGPGSVCR